MLYALLSYTCRYILIDNRRQTDRERGNVHNTVTFIIVILHIIMSDVCKYYIMLLSRARVCGLMICWWTYGYAYSLLNLKTANTRFGIIYNREPNHVVGGKTKQIKKLKKLTTRLIMRPCGGNASQKPVFLRHRPKNAPVENFNRLHVYQ